MVEIGTPDKSPLLLTDQHLRLMADHLPRQYEALCNANTTSAEMVNLKLILLLVTVLPECLWVKIYIF